jgi:hypothetical protein
MNDQKHFISQITLVEQIAELQRELQMRQRVYPRWVDQGRLSQSTAAAQILTMTAALATLQDLAKKTGPQPSMF